MCTASAVPVMARAEGVSEPLGDIVVGCNGAPVSTTGNLNLFLTAVITNRVTADGLAPGVVVSVDGVPTGVTGRVSGQSINFTGVRLTVPAGGAVTLRVSGLRANLSQLGAENRQPVQAYISTTLSSLALGNNPVTVAMPARGLLATAADGGIPCTGSPAPSSIGLAELFSAETNFASTRVTEGFASAFRPRETGADSGTRFMARYTGLPAGARVFVPDVVAGSNAVQPTAGGDLGLSRSGGQYAPGSNSLLLSRVMGADANGAGGVPVFAPGATGSGTVALNNAAELPVVNGAAYAVYEVMDADPTQRESAQWPAFVALANVNQTAIARETISFAPLSTDPAASAQAAIPRFAYVEPASDCSALGDCESGVFPKLYVNAGPQQFSAIQGGAAMQGPGYIPVRNTGGGVMSWTARVTYKNGDGWLKLEPVSGINNGAVRVYPLTQNLAAGKYEAAVIIDGGVRAGSQSVPVVLVVTALPPANPPPPPAPPAPPAPPKAAITGLSNAADARMQTLAPGALATLRGVNLAGQSVQVTFDGAAAKLLYASGTQINVLVPAQLAGKESAQVVVTVDGSASAPATARLAAAAPGIFAGGVLNQDGSVNGDAAGALPGSVLQIFATGLPLSDVAVKIHDRDGLAPLYAGAVSGAEGVQQVNVMVPAELPAMETEVLVCAGQACSWPVRLVLQ
ncbi:MAG: IPT/TIG domain-containing protein [Bryobacteraceae bacterium]